MKASGLDSQLNAKWARVRGRLRSEYGEQAYRSWLKPLTLVRSCQWRVPHRRAHALHARLGELHYADRVRPLLAVR